MLEYQSIAVELINEQHEFFSHCDLRDKPKSVTLLLVALRAHLPWHN